MRKPRAKCYDVEIIVYNKDMKKMGVISRRLIGYHYMQKIRVLVDTIQCTKDINVRCHMTIVCNGYTPTFKLSKFYIDLDILHIAKRIRNTSNIKE